MPVPSVRRYLVLLLPVLGIACNDSTPSSEEPWDVIPPFWDPVQRFADAYVRRNLSDFIELLSTEPGAAYRGPLGLGAEAEICLHQRMFEPENPPPGQPPVPAELWPAGIALSLVPNRDWSERPDLYRSAANPEGLDPNRWRATEADYSYAIFFDTLTENDFEGRGTCNFIVLQDRSKSSGEDRQFLLYRWEDRGGVPPPATGRSTPVAWADLLELFRCE